jgi:hypothetical protein
MRFEQIAPALVAQLLRPRGRTHDIREQYGCKDTVALCRGDGPGQKFLDCVNDVPVDEEEMILPR